MRATTFKKVSLFLEEETVEEIDRVLSNRDTRAAMKLLKKLREKARVSRTCQCGVPFGESCC